MARDDPLTRRTVLRTGSTVAIAGLLAGCAGGDGGDGGGGQEPTTEPAAETTETTATATETETTTAEPTTQETTTQETTETGTGSPATDGGDGSADLESWFSGVENYDGVTDMTGQEEVSVAVGAQGNGGNFAFDPPAVRVSTGTTVVWEWTGQGGSHNVVAQDGTFESELAQNEGHTFEHVFESAGTYRYVCTPHESLGMKGAVVVE